MRELTEDIKLKIKNMANEIMPDASDLIKSEYIKALEDAYIAGKLEIE